jgi:hypothetical protein
MPKPATRKGVETPVADPADVQMSTRNPRNEYLREIAKTTEHDMLLGEATDDPTLTPESVDPEEHQAQLDLDEKPEVKEPPADDEPETPKPDKVEPEPKEEAAQTEDPEDYIEATTYGKKKVRVKIDGEDRVVTFDELVRDAQKKGTADKRLEEATKLLNETKEIHSRARPSREDAVQTQIEQPPELDPGVAAMVQAMRTGTDEEATFAAQEWQKEIRKKATVPDDALRAYVNDAMDFRSSADWCKSEYSDLFADATLGAMFADRDERQVRAGDKRAYRERYKEIGEDLRTWRNSLTKSSPAPTQTLEAKREKKAAVATPTSAAVKDVRPVVEDETEDNVQDVIAAMAKKRGQQLRTF